MKWRASRVDHHDDEYIDGWIDLCWPGEPDGPAALESPYLDEYAIVFPDGRILIYTDVDKMWKSWEEMMM